MPEADLILVNANIITMTPAGRASAVAVSKGRIAALGDAASLHPLAGRQTLLIDCQGKTVIPGFIDAHCHLFSFVRQLLSLDLSSGKVDCIAAIKEAVKNRAASLPAGAWLSGTGLNDYHLVEKRLPTRRELDAAAPDNPVVLAHVSLHEAVLNSRALAMAGIRRGCRLPEGATADLDAEGEPTGRVCELLGYLREQVMPPLSERELEAGINMINRHYLAHGITSLGEATIVNNLERCRILKRFKENGLLIPRVAMMFGYGFLPEIRAVGLAFRSGDDGLRLGHEKIILTESTGRVFPGEPELSEIVRQSEAAGFPVAIHATGEDSIRTAVTVLEKATKPELRHRIEHCLECSPGVMERLRLLKPVIVTQPSFLYYGGERMLASQPENHQSWYYRFKSLDTILNLAGSSDSPVAGDNPLMGIYAAVTRRTNTGRVIGADEALSALAALRMYTIGAAYAAGDENIKGSITPGKLADMVVLDGNPLDADPADIKNIKVLTTIAGGRVAWED